MIIWVVIFLIIFLGMPVGHYVCMRSEQVEDIEKTVDGKIFKVVRNRKWYE
jgi:hypothetical protein